MTVITEKPLEGLDNLPGVYNVHQEQHGLCFHVDVDKMGPVINHLNQFGIKKLDSSPPTLEELFMQHYTREEDAG
jgi:ABC-2 type transport system ATP-binding protein